MARSREEYLKAKREGMAAHRAKDPDAYRAKQKAWADANREHVRKSVRDYERRRFFWNKACKLRRDHGAEAASHYELAKAWKSQRGLCGISGRRLTRDTAEIDHIMPKVKGGSGSISNLRWVCKEANRAKRDLTDEEFILLCRNCMEWIGERIALVDSMEAAA